MAFRDGVQYSSKQVDDDSNPTNTSETVDVDANPGISKTPSSNGLGPQSWTSTDQAQTMPSSDQGSTRSYPMHGMMPMTGYGRGDIDSGSANDMSGTSPDRPSNGPTPNSSTASEQQQQQQRHTLGPTTTRISSSGRNSFEASPVPAHQNINMGAPSAAQGDVPVQSVNGFFGGPASYSMPAGVATGMTPDQRYAVPSAPAGAEFTVPPGWADMSAQPTGMTPVAEGVFRSIISMGAIDTMDLAWDTNP